MSEVCRNCQAPVDVWTDADGRRFRDELCDGCLQEQRGPAAVLWRLVHKGSLDHLLEEPKG